MKNLILISILAIIASTFFACKGKTKPETIIYNEGALELKEQEEERKREEAEAKPLKDSVMKIVNFVSNPENESRFDSWDKYPGHNDTIFDYVAKFEVDDKSYEITFDSWSISLQIKGKNSGSGNFYYIADSGPDGKPESGFWDGYPQGDKREKAYIVGIFAHSDETQICCDYKEYWQAKYKKVIKDIYTELKL